MTQTRRGLLPCAALAAALALGGRGIGGARADLRGPRDVTRAIEALESNRDAQREAAARWLGAHGPDAIVVPALLEALDEEDDVATTVPLALALARRARAEDAPRLLALEPTLRSAGRVTIVVALAQLGTEESDDWLVSRLASPAGVELRPAIEQAAEIARQRREVILPRVLDAIADHDSPLLVSWLASLADERARAVLLASALQPGPSREVALEGLARLGPDADTAERLAVPGVLEEMRTGPIDTASAYVHALLAANGEADLSAFLPDTTPELRASALDALVERAPVRAVATLGVDPAAIPAGDRHVLAAAIAHPSPALVPWLEAMLGDASLDTDTRSGALEALVALPACSIHLDAALGGELALDEARLADARLARACPTRSLAPHPLEGPAALHLEAIAGRDVRAAIFASFSEAPRPDRLALAHAWLSSVQPDARLLGALEAETDAEIFAVLALAATTHGLDPAPAPERLEDPRTRLAALDLALASSVAPSPRALRAIEQMLGSEDPQLSALALRALGRHHPRRATAFACAALESSEPVLARAAWHVLLAASPRHDCVRWRARVDPALRAALATEAREPEAGPLVLRVVSNVGGALQRVSIETLDGRTSRLRPPPDGLIVAPPIGPAEVRLRLDREAGDR